MSGCIQYLCPEPGEALVWCSPWGVSVLRYGRDDPRWSLFSSVFQVPTSKQSGELISERALTNDAIEVRLLGSLSYSICSETDSMLIDMAERFWSRGSEGLSEAVLDMSVSIQSSVLGELTINQMRSTEGMALFVSKIKIILERELEPLGLRVQGYYVKELSDHGGYLNALDGIKIAEIVKESRFNTAEKRLENAVTEAQFKAHEFQRSLEEKKCKFNEEKPPQLTQLRSLMEQEIHRANVSHEETLTEMMKRKRYAEETGSRRVEALRREVDAELENYVEEARQRLEQEVRAPARQTKEEMESEALLSSEEFICEVRKEARHAVLESERRAVKISAETEKSLERIRMAAAELKDYPLRDFIAALQTSVEEDGIIKPFVDLITNLLKDFDERRQMKKDDVPRKSCGNKEEDEVMLMDFKEQDLPHMPIALSI